MAITNIPYSEQQRSLADLMLAVSGESVTVMKKNAPEQALKLKRQDEWKLYLEFLKVTFNLADRLSAFHIPIKDQPDFMNGLEDAVTSRLRSVLDEPGMACLRTDRETVAMNSGTFTVDLLTIQSSLALGMDAASTEELVQAASALGASKTSRLG